MMMLVVIYRDILLLHPSPAEVEHYRPLRWWLLPHGIGGALALFLGPLQFSKRFRQRHLRWHRFAGRAYVYGVAVAAPLGVYIEVLKFTHGIGSLRLVVATLGFASLFVITTGIGFLNVIKGKIEQHRKWMTRSYAVALIFLESRCIEQIPWLASIYDWPSRLFESHSTSDLWILIILAPIAAEMVLTCERLLTSRSRAAERSTAVFNPI